MADASTSGTPHDDGVDPASASVSSPRAAQTSSMPANQSHPPADVDAGLEQLLQTFVPPSFLCTVGLDIVHSFGNSGRFLQLRPGVAQLNLQRFVDPAMATALRTGALRAETDGKTVTLNDHETTVDGQALKVDVTVMPLQADSHRRAGLLLIVFEDKTCSRGLEGAANTKTPDAPANDGLGQIALPSTSPTDSDAPTFVRQSDILLFLQDGLHDGYWDSHFQTGYEYMSPRFWQMLGYQPDEKAHNPNEWKSICHPIDLELAQTDLEAHIATRGEHPYCPNLRFRHKNGSWVIVQRRGRVVVWDRTGLAVRMVGTHTDITLVTVLAERDRLVAEGASVGIWDWLEIKNDEQVWSGRLHHMLGFTPGELKPSFSTLKSLIHPDDVDQMIEVLAGHLDRNEPFDTEFRLRTKASGYRWMRCSGMASRDELGKPIRMVGSIEDVHARKVAVEDLWRSNEELRQFTYAASHDLQAPLRHVRAYTDLLHTSLGDALTGEQQQFMKYIQASTNHMKALIDALLRFSRLEADAIHREPVALDDVLADVKLILRDTLRQSGAALDLGPLPVVIGDKALLTQLFQNLLDNAIKFRDESRPLAISIDALGDDTRARIRVRDNGIGIAPNHQQRVFQIFQRVRRIEAPGTGVGLAICKKVAERLGGWIEVHSAEGEGATFSVYLPTAG